MSGIVVSLTAINVVFGITVGILGSESSAGFVAAALVAGTFLEGSQSVVVRKRVPSAGWWIPATEIGIAILAMTFTRCSRGADTLMVGAARVFLAAAAAAGAAYGIWTGAALYFLLPTRIS